MGPPHGKYCQWEDGLSSYLLAGVIFTLIWLVAGWLIAPVALRMPPLWLLVAFPILWPEYSLTALGIFYWTPPFGY
jgi:hypothetical protein